MFDIGFSEIVVIAVVALIVIGPEKLPKTARTLGHLFGRLQRYVSDVKADISREIELEELRKLQQQVQSAAKDLEHSMASAAHEMESGVKSVESQLNAAAADAPAPGNAGAGADVVPTDRVEPPVSPAAMAGAGAPAAEPSRQASLPGFDRG